MNTKSYNYRAEYVWNSFKYFCITVYSNIIGFIAMIITAKIVRSSYESGMLAYSLYLVVFTMILGCIISFIIVSLISSYCVRKFIYCDLISSENKISVYLTYLKTIIPGELLRFIITILPWGKCWFTSYAYIGTILNIDATLIFDQFYLTGTGRIHEVAEYGIGTVDYFVYLLINCFAFMLHIIGVLFLLSYNRKQEIRRKEKEIRITMDDITGGIHHESKSNDNKT